jgi:predicted dehydrogenase
MSRSTLRVGVIGTGAIAQNHVVGYRAAGARIVAICDVNEGMLAKRQREWEVAAGYTDYAELLRHDGLDAVSICTPNAPQPP